MGCRRAGRGRGHGMSLDTCVYTWHEQVCADL